MKITRAIAVGVILGSLALSALNAQTLRNSAPPAEFPPTSYKGNQYVDSRGCIYIRAGIDGNVTWIPRVSRSRKQLCGYKPSAIAGSTPATPPRTARPPVIITAIPPASPNVATIPSTTTAPRREPRPPPPPTVFNAPKPAEAAPPAPRVVATTPRATTPKRREPRPPPPPTVFNAPKPATTAAAPRTATPQGGGNCSNASAFSQQYINKPDGRFAVRCGPQAEPPVTYGLGEKSSSLESLPPDTRIVPRHVYDNRQNTTNVSIPAGYRTVWEDDRLNPYRAERTLRPAEVKGVVNVPPGYRLVDWGDGRLNLRRGIPAGQGEAQANQIWTNTVPRKLIAVPTQPPVVQVPAGTLQAQVSRTSVVTRVSTRSAAVVAKPVTPTPARTPKLKGRYVHVAIYAGDAEARAVARALAGTGLPTRVGAVKSSGYRIVLAGPFSSNSKAKAALKQLRGAGYLEAKMNR